MYLFDRVSAAEVCSLFCPSGGETPTESALSSAKRGKTPGQSVIITDSIKEEIVVYMALH